MPSPECAVTPITSGLTVGHRKQPWFSRSGKPRSYFYPRLSARQATNRLSLTFSILSDPKFQTQCCAEERKCKNEEKYLLNNYNGGPKNKQNGRREGNLIKTAKQKSKKKKHADIQPISRPRPAPLPGDGGVSILVCGSWARSHLHLDPPPPSPFCTVSFCALLPNLSVRTLPSIFLLTFFFLPSFYFASAVVASILLPFSFFLSPSPSFSPPIQRCVSCSWLFYPVRPVSIFFHPPSIYHHLFPPSLLLLSTGSGSVWC